MRREAAFPAARWEADVRDVPLAFGFALPVVDLRRVRVMP
jgi:hypothetical protein